MTSFPKPYGRLARGMIFRVEIWPILLLFILIPFSFASLLEAAPDCSLNPPTFLSKLIMHTIPRMSTLILEFRWKTVKSTRYYDLGLYIFTEGVFRNDISYSCIIFIMWIEDVKSSSTLSQLQPFFFFFITKASPVVTHTAESFGIRGLRILPLIVMPHVGIVIMAICSH